MLYVMMVIDEPSKGKWKERIQENEFLFNYIITKFYRNKKDKNIERFITNLFRAYQKILTTQKEDINGIIHYYYNEKKMNDFILVQSYSSFLIALIDFTDNDLLLKGLQSFMIIVKENTGYREKIELIL